MLICTFNYTQISYLYRMYFPVLKRILLITTATFTFYLHLLFLSYAPYDNLNIIHIMIKLVLHNLCL